MLETLDLTKKMEKDEYKERMNALVPRIGELQRTARAMGIPVMVVFEGWDAAGKGTLINRLLLSLDPRGYTVHPISAPNVEERLRPFLWRFWTRTPARGRIAIFDRSWYGRLLVERVDKIVKKHVWQEAYEDIAAFERQLSVDGTVIVKFFLHIDAKEQKKRFKKLEKNKSTAWKVTDEDWKHHKEYDKHLEATEEMLARTDKASAPWTVVEAHDRRFATVKVFQTVIRAIESRIAEKTAEEAARKKQPKVAASVVEPLASSSILDTADLSLELDRQEYDEELDKCQERIRELEHEVYVKRLPVMILYEGCDAGGKGGNIKRLVRGMDPRGYEVIPVAAPNDVEKAHHYLWRFWRDVPKAGHIAIFDRTWYGRVLVERVEGFCRVDEWKRAYAEINEMERQLGEFGMAIVKFWIHISKEEQLRRFEERENTPQKKWKITDEDWRNREKWDAYKTAVDEMLYRTSTPHAPWTVVEGNCKWYARIKALKTVIAAIEEKL